MNSSKKQETVEQQRDNESNVPFLSPGSNPDVAWLRSLNMAIHSFLPIESIPSKKQLLIEECNSQNLLLSSQSYKSQKQSDQGHAKNIENSPLKQLNMSFSNELSPKLSKTERQKYFKVSQGFQVPQLTAESLISSEQFDMENEYRYHELLLSSNNRYKIDKLFHDQSEGSDQMPEHDDKYRKYQLRQEYAESKSSDKSEIDDIPSTCKQCSSLLMKHKSLDRQSIQLIKQNLYLKQELQKYQEKNNQDFEKQETSQNSMKVKQIFLSQIQESLKTLPKINELLLSYAIDFRENDFLILKKFSQEFKILDKNIFGNKEKQERKLQLEQLHKQYKKLIAKIIKKHEEKDMKKEQQFKKFMSILSEKQKFEAKIQHMTELKLERNRKKSKIYAQREQNTAEELYQQTRAFEQNKQKIQWLQLNYSKQKERCRQIQKQFKQLNQKLNLQLSELIKERNAYKQQANKFTAEFKDFMYKLPKIQGKFLTQSYFFTNICQRIFQISNCIPFEDNDEQNLFAPEDQEELFDMIQRIRRFYMKLETYNLNRENYYQTEKNCFVLFLKKMIQESVVSDEYLLKMLENKQFKRIFYLKQLIYSSRERIKGDGNVKFSEKEPLKIQKVNSFTFNSVYHSV